MLSTHCWLYGPDFRPSASLKTTTDLIVKGDCMIPAGSIVEADLKASGTIQIGARSICRGNIIAGGDIRFDHSSSFLGIVHAGKTLRLEKGVRGGTEHSKVAAFAADGVTIGNDVVVHGKLASGGLVVVAPEAGKRSH